MVKNIWTILCTKSNIDKESNDLSLFEVVDELVIYFNEKDLFDEKKLKSVVTQLELVGVWFKNDLKVGVNFDIVLELSDPQNKKLKEVVMSFIIPEGKKRLRVRTKINGLVFTSQGLYKLKVKYKEKGAKNFVLASEIPLDVIFKSAKDKK